MKTFFYPSALIAIGLSAVALVPACGGESVRHVPASDGGSNGNDAAGGTSGDTSRSTGGTSSAAGGTGHSTGGTGAGSSTGGTGFAVGGTNGTTGGTGSAVGGTASAVGGTTSAVGGTASAVGGTSSAAAGRGGASHVTCNADGNRTLAPDETGWLDRDAVPCNDVGVHGAWYAFGDQYGSSNCLILGLHEPEECAQIFSPDPTLMVFPNMNGVMQTSGSVEMVLPCVAGSKAATIATSGCPGGGMAGGFDYASMWGAGIGFDLAANPGPPEGDGKRNTWDPSVWGVIGIRFVIKGVPVSGMRVEFPIALTAAEARADVPAITTLPPTTDDHSAGAPYWGATPDGTYRNSPVIEGENVITWDEIGVPKAGVYTFDPSRLLAVRFHVPATRSNGSAYSFAISGMTFLRHL